MKIISKTVIFLLISISGNIFSQTVNIPLGHWAYRVLEHFETRGMVKGALNNTKPFTRREFAVYADSLFDYYSKHENEFTRVEKEWLEEIRSEFYDDLNLDIPQTNSIHTVKNSIVFKSWWPKIFYENNRNFYSFNYKEFDFFFDFVFRLNQSSEPWNDIKDTRLYMSNGFTFRGKLGTFLGYYFDLTDNTYWGDFGVPRGLDVIKNSGLPWVNTQNPEKIMFDENVFYLLFSFPYIDFELGRDYTKWGPMKSGQLGISSHSPAYDMIRMTFAAGRFKLTGVTGFLIDIPPGTEYNIKSQPKVKKFLAGSRFEINLGAGVQLGLNQMIIYSNRDLELGYLIPFSFYKSSEHYYGDRDNGAIGFDIEWNLYPGYKIYGEAFFDDISTSKIGTGFYGNKWAGGAGFFSYNFLGINDLAFRAEYTRIEPYVYTHTFASNKYKNYDSNLGHWIGPNSDLTFAQADYWITRKLWFTGEFYWVRHGANPPDRNVGGDIDRPFESGDNEISYFLDGIVEEKYQYSLTAHYEFIRRFYIFGGGGIKGEVAAYSEPYWRIGFEWNYGQK